MNATGLSIRYHQAFEPDKEIPTRYLPEEVSLLSQLFIAYTTSPCDIMFHSTEAMRHHLIPVT